MSESRALLCDTAERLFSVPDLSAEYLAQSGLPLLLVPESHGGFGGDWGDAFEIFRLAGRHLVGIPVAETVIAAWAASAAGLSQLETCQVLAKGDRLEVSAERATGRLYGVPWATGLSHVVCLVDDRLVRISVDDAVEVGHRIGLAGTDMADLTFADAEIELGQTVACSDALGFAHCSILAGMMDATLALTITYANERSQFGRPLAKFQAVQQALAVFAEEAAAVTAAAQAAGRALDRSDGAFEVTAARIMASRGTDIGIKTAHQIHGAIGFTQEHILQRYTRRMMAARATIGPSASWSLALGRQVVAVGADQFWPELTQRSDPSP